MAAWLSRQLVVLWLSIFLLGIPTFAEPTEEPVPTEPNEGSSTNTYQSSSWSPAKSTTTTQSSLSPEDSSTASPTVSLVSNNIKSSPQKSQVITTVVDKHLTTTTTPTPRVSNVQSTVSTLLNPTAGTSFSIASSQTKTSMIGSSQSSVFLGGSEHVKTTSTNGILSKVLHLSTTATVQEVSSSTLKTTNVLNTTRSSSILPVATKAASLTPSFAQNATSTSILETATEQHILNMTRFSSILPNATHVATSTLITSTIIPSSSSVCIGCAQASSSSHMVPNSTVFGVSPSPSSSRTLDVWNQTTFPSKTSSNRTSIKMEKTTNLSHFVMSSTVAMNISTVLNQTAVLSAVRTSSVNQSLSFSVAQTSTVEGYSTVYSKLLNYTASSSAVPGMSSSVLSTPTATPVNAPSAPPQDVEVHNKSSTSIFVTWKLPPSGTLKGVLTKYEVLVQKLVLSTTTPSISHSNSVAGIGSTYITTASSSSVRDTSHSISASGTSLSLSTSVPSEPTETPVEPTSPPEALVTPINAGLNLSIIVSGLQKFTFYEVRVRAVTVRPGPYSSPLTVQTDEDVPNACRNISLSNLNSTSVMVHWTRPLQINGLLLGYKIYYGLNDTRLSTKDVSSDVEAYLLNGLLPFTSYIINVTAYTRIGQGKEVSTFFKTLEAVPSAVRNLTAKTINSTAVQISWTRPEYPNGEIKYVTMKRKSSDEESVASVQICHGPETQCIAVGLHPVTHYTFIVYAMNIKNQWQSTIVEVTVVTSPSEPDGPPLDIQVITKNSTSMLVQWLPPSFSLRNGLIMRYVVQYSTDKTAFQSRTTQDNRTSLLLTPLTPYTLYYIRVQAVNLVGAGPFSELVANRTFEGAPSPPTKITARSVNATCVLVTWGQPEHLNGETVSYKLYYRLTSLNASHNSRVYDGESTIYLVSGLQENVKYTFTLFAYNVKYGYKSTSVVAMETTHPAAPSGPPQNTRAITLSSRSIVVTWTAPKALDMNGIITGYIVNINLPDGISESRNVSNNMLVFESLRPYTVYFFTIQAVNKIGVGPPSSPVSNRTFEDTPDAPIIDQVTNLTSTALQVSWMPPRNPNGVLVAFEICWALRNRTCKETDGTTRTYSLYGLVPFSWYNISIAAATSRGYGPSVSGIYRTMEGVPTKPQNLQAWNTSASSIFVTWTAPAMTNGILISYVVSYKPSHGSSPVDAGLATNVTIHHLVPFTVYNVCVHAVTRPGFGPEACESVSTGEGVPGAIQSFDALSSTPFSIELKWSAPSLPNGQIGYILYYYSTTNPEWNQTHRFPNSRLEFSVRGLNPYTNYTFSISAYNLKTGLVGPARVVTALTKATLPSGPPLNVRLIKATTETLTISWDPPAKPNGPIKSYILFVNDVKTPEDKDYQNAYNTTHTITSLNPGHVYSIQIATESVKFGPMTKKYEFETLPSAPPLVPPIKPPDKDMITSNEIIIKLQKASDENGKVSFYQVVVLEIATDDAGTPITPTKEPRDYKPSDLFTYHQAKERKPDLVPYIAAEFQAKDFEEYRMFKVGDAKNYSISARKRRDTDAQYYNGPLEPDTYYTMFQRAAVSKDLYTSTSWLQPVSTEESSAAAKRTNVSSSNTGLVVGLCVTFLLIIAFIVIVFVILWKKRRFDFGVMLDDESNYTGGRSLKLKKIRGSKRRTSSRGLMGSTDSIDNIVDNRRRQPIPIEEFGNHVRRMHTDGDIGFSEEYELVQPNDEDFTWHHSLHSANKYKNRYANIIAYDHSRVLLTPIEGAPGSDYINANYIDGYNRSGGYIACQGPLSETFDDFWRMIWEQGTATIVMLTQLEERGRRKCDQYWPDRGTKNYGVIRVTASETSHMSYYILRTFILSHKQEEEEPRQVKQYHFTSWPDHGVPTHPAPLLSLVRTVSNANPCTAGPIVVHCSAGVGRTGTYITLDAMLQRIEKEQTIDVFEFVRQMRTKRNIMVQTEIQYVFIYDALNEAVSCGVTEVEAKKFGSRLRELREVEPNTGRTYLEKEFLRLVKDERHHSTFKNANLGANSSKNRYANILPYEKSRVHLKMRPGEVGSDFINASYIDGYCRLSAFIATQAPLPHTFEDFWRMIWEQRSSVIVMLTREEEAGKVKCHRYWPSEGTRVFDDVLVELTEEVAYSDYIMRQFSLTHTEEKEVRTVRQYQFTDWPDVGLPESGVGIIDLIGQIEKWQQQSSNSIITVHCSGGVGRTGVFCAVSILIERVKAEGVIDVFQTVQSLRLQRPAMVQTMEQYEFCYSTLQEYLDSFDLYANFQ